MEGSGQLHAVAALPQDKEPLYLLNMRLSGLRGGSGQFGELKNLLSLRGFKASSKICYEHQIVLPLETTPVLLIT
jgi:hypothetical protein